MNPAILLFAACSAPPAPVPPPPALPPAGAPAASGAALQDPSGFPAFHDQPAPPGPAIARLGAFGVPTRLSEEPGGGYRPQVAASPASGELHVVFYERAEAGDLIRHRRSADGGATWSAPAPLGFARERNWGPDIVARDDGSVVVAFDHALPDMTSRGYLTAWRDGSWSAPEALTPDDGGEIGSGHVAHGAGEDLAYVYIGKALGPEHRFQARWRWFTGGAWSPVAAFTDGSADAWHTNVERRPDGSVLAGYDVGVGGGATTLYLTDGRDGAFGAPEDMTATGPTGERPHFAFGPDGRDHVAWFHKEQGRPLHVYTRAGRPGAWGPAAEPSAGFGGYHFDPDLAVNAAGTLCLVWGWDGGDQAELVYALDEGAGWTAPALVARVGWGKPGLASIDADAAGRFHVVWNQGVRGSNHVYYARLDP